MEGLGYLKSLSIPFFFDICALEPILIFKAPNLARGILWIFFTQNVICSIVLCKCHQKMHKKHLGSSEFILKEPDMSF